MWIGVHRPSHGQCSFELSAWLFGSGLLPMKRLSTRMPLIPRWDATSFVDRRSPWRNLLAIREGKREQRTDYALAIVDDTEGDVIGAGELHVDSIRHHRGEVGYILRRETWGRGLPTEVAGLLLRCGFDELRLHRLWATCDPANAASIRVLEKVGMRREGLLREHYLAHDGTWRDAVVYAAIRDSTKG